MSPITAFSFCNTEFLSICHWWINLVKNDSVVSYLQNIYMDTETLVSISGLPNLPLDSQFKYNQKHHCSWSGVFS